MRAHSYLTFRKLIFCTLIVPTGNNADVYFCVCVCVCVCALGAHGQGHEHTLLFMDECYVHTFNHKQTYHCH